MKRIAVVVVSLTVTISALLYWFSLEIRKTMAVTLENNMNAASIVIESRLVDTIDHTEFIMKMLNNQIAVDPNNMDRINNIITKYYNDDAVDNTMSWSRFSWANRNYQTIADSKLGLIEPYDLSMRDYLPLTVKQPDRIHLGEPVFGTTTNRWVVPAGVGVRDRAGNYIGAMTVGFDLNTLAEQLRSSVKDKNINFYIIGKNSTLLIDSAATKQGPANLLPDNVATVLENTRLTSKSMEVFELDVTDSGKNYYIKKFNKVPFVIYASYNPDYVKQQFYSAIFGRLSELLILGLVSALIALYIYKREKMLRKKSESLHKIAVSASKAKTDFMAYTGHELRSPLNVIIFASEMMKNKMFGDLSPKYLEYAEDIHQNGNDLLHFIEDLLDVTRAEEGAFRLNREVTDMNEVIERVVNLNAARANKHKIKIATLIQKNLPKLWVDPRRLRQILNNLLSNSIKYSPDDSKINVVVHAIDGIMQIVIEDQGFGMTAQQLKVALSKYGTVKNENTGKVDSIGLGLPLVKNLVEAHGAKFDIESEVGIGTKVTLSFPLHEIDSNDKVIREIEHKNVLPLRKKTT